MHLQRPKAARVHPDAYVAEQLVGRTKAINVQATIARHRLLGKALGGVYDVILNQASTPRRQRELVILRMGWNCGAEYEFGQHTLYGKNEGGLTDEEVLATTRPLSAYPWPPDDLDLLRMSDELYTDCCVTDSTWAALKERWGDEDLIELMSTTLAYFMVSGLLNSLGVQLDEGVPGWPAAATGSTFSD